MAKSDQKTTQKTESALIGPNTVITLTVDAKTAATAYQKALGRLAKQIKVPGFRKGKVPTHLAEKELNPSAIIDQALETVIPPLYQSEVVDKKLESLTQPEFKAVKLDKNSDWIVEVHLAQKPKIIIKDLKKNVKAGKKVAEAEIKKQREHIAEIAKLGETKNHEGHHHPSEEDITLTHIYQRLVTNLRPTLPELLVKEEVRADLQNLVQRLQSLNLTLDDYLKQQNMTYEDLTNQMAVAAVGRLQLMFILDAISEQEKFEVTEAELKTELKKRSTQDNNPDKNLEKDPRYLDFVRQTLKREKLTQYLLGV